VRVLRVARFAARFADFHVAEETLALMRLMADNGEVDHLVPERVWQELARGLMEARPSRMFEVLRACGALAKVLPELDRLFGVPQPAEHHPEIDTGGQRRSQTHPRQRRQGARRGHQSSQPISPAITENTTAEAKGKAYSLPRRRKRRSPGRRPSGSRRAIPGCSSPTRNTAANRTISHFSMRGAR
jgi:hypothetical protein